MISLSEDIGLAGNSIIKKFKIKGLNDFKDISIETKDKALIIVAENGSGKTTLFNALYAILTGRLSYLHKIKFKSIEIELENLEKKLVIEKSEIFSGEILDSNCAHYKRLVSIGVEDGELIDFIDEFRYGLDFFDTRVRTNHILSRLRSRTGMPLREGVSFLKNFIIKSIDSSASDKLAEVFKYISEYEILYLPTYRRIEADRNQVGIDYSDENSGFPVRGREGHEKVKRLISFGMRDVDLLLEEIKLRIKNATYEAYSRISMKSIPEFLKDDQEIFVDTIDSEMKTEFELIVNRVGDIDKKSYNKLIELIDDGEINGSRYKSLRSYLWQIYEVYQVTKLDEASIESFVNIINSYWVTSAEESGSKQEKKMYFNKKDLSIYIKHAYSKSKLELSDLSSGEKQIVSMFAKLIFEKEKKLIILIDEPEISLSTEWQKRFLSDVARNKNCSQLIAVTHSPYIFNDSLKRFATPLITSYHEEYSLE